MRLRLISSFILIALVSVASVLIVARQTTLQEVHTYMFRGGMAGVEGLVTALEDYYRVNQSWEGAEPLFGLPGQLQGNRRGNQGKSSGAGGVMGGMMDQRLRLADAQGNLIVDTETPNVEGSLTRNE